MLRVLTIGNYAIGIGFALLLAASLFARAIIADRLAAKYGATLDMDAAFAVLRLVLLGGLIGVWAVARLFRALAAMMASVRVGEPFTVENAGRLRVIGWMLLLLQLLDLGGGIATWRMARLGVEYADWTPSFTGWLAVLVAFILARVFAQGAALREDVEGTV